MLFCYEREKSHLHECERERMSSFLPLLPLLLLLPPSSFIARKRRPLPSNASGMAKISNGAG